ncbi:DUF1461 domain-containing protein [Bacillus cereus]
MEKNKSGTKILDRLITLVVSYSIAFSIFALATTAVVYGKWLYYFEIDFLNIPDLADMTKDEIKRNYDVLITYLSPFYDGALHLPTLDMSTNGRIHFVDVKKYFSKDSICDVCDNYDCSDRRNLFIKKRKMKSFYCTDRF